MVATFVAEIVRYLHFAYLAGVVVPIPLILLGPVFGWYFVRIRWFRRVHLLMIFAAVLLTFLNLPCPLTVWENTLREWAGQQGYQGGFAAHWLPHLILENSREWLVNALSIFGGILGFVLYFLIPPDDQSRFR